MDKSLYKSIPIQSSEITPEHIYRSRRQFLKTMGILGAGTLLAACAPRLAEESPTTEQDSAMPVAQASTDELGDPLNTYEQITNYNNYYEFSVVKQEVADLAQGFVPNQGNGVLPYTLQVNGLVNKPKTYGLEDLLKFPQEERVYRLRCVEAWSMVIPWIGFPLAQILKEVEPLSSAKYVRFETVLDPEQMPGQRRKNYPWPYQEGLRLDEAMHDLTILATGLYGKELPAQSGMPVRVVVPWKYGYKSPKSIVKIELVADEPATLWNTVAPDEYGFYSNVNPEVDHPRWSQKTERRIGESSRRKTLMFNGYTEQVADLYKGMDLWVYY
jgi:sulfoxide reductase catalytic subunit YedY